MLWGGSSRRCTLLLCGQVLPRLRTVIATKPRVLRRCQAVNVASHALRRAPDPLTNTVHPPAPPNPSPVQMDMRHNHEENVDQRPALIEISSLPSLVSLIDDLFSINVTSKQVSSIYRQIEECQPWMAFFHDENRVKNLAVYLAGCPTPYACRQLLIVAQDFGARPFKLNMYENIVHRLAEGRHWALIPPLVELGQSQTGRTSVRLLNWRTKALVELGQFSALESIPASFAEYNLVPNRRTYHIIIKGHLSNHDIAQTKIWLRRMEEEGIPVDASTHAALISVYRGLGPDKLLQARATQAIPHVEPVHGTAIVNSLLRLALDKDDISGALTILRTFVGGHHILQEQLTGTDGDDVHSNAEQHNQHAPQADAVTYAMLIDFLVKTQEIQRLPGLLTQMKNAGVTPDSGVAAALIRAHYTQNSELLALRVLYDLCRPTGSHLKLFKCIGYRTASHRGPLCGPFKGEPTVEAFNAVLSGALSLRGLGSVNPILRLMEAYTITPSSLTAEILLSHIDQCDASPSDMVNFLSSLFSQHGQASVRHMNILARSAVRAEKRLTFRGGWNALGTLVKGALVPSGKLRSPSPVSSDIFGPTAGLIPPVNKRRRAELASIVEDLDNRGVNGTRATFALRMRQAALSRSGDEGADSARQVLNDMIARGMHPTAHHFAALMEAYTSAGDIQSAREVLQEAIIRTQPSAKSLVVLHTILMTGYARLGRPDYAMRAFQNMIRGKVAPDAAAVDSVVSAFFAVKAFRLARQVLLELWPMVAPPVKGMQDASLRELVMKLRSMRNDAGFRKQTIHDIRMRRQQTRSIIALWRSMSSVKSRPSRVRRQCRKDSTRSVSRG